MSMKDLYEAIVLINKNPELSDFEKGISDKKVNEAEIKLNVKFPNTYKSFLKTFGSGGFGSHEFYGISNNNFEDKGMPYEIWLNLITREGKNALPK